MDAPFELTNAVQGRFSVVLLPLGDFGKNTFPSQFSDKGAFTRSNIIWLILDSGLHMTRYYPKEQPRSFRLPCHF